MAINRISWAVLFIVFTLFIGWIAQPSPTFQNCIQEHKQPPPEQTLPKKGESLLSISERGRLVVTCGFELIEKHDGLVTALFTVILTLSTIALWRATAGLFVETAKLRAAAEDQTMIEINRRMQEIMGDQNTIMRKQVEITQFIQRARIGFNNYSAKPRFDENRGMPVAKTAGRWSIQAMWINSGPTRAVKCKNWVNVIFLPGDDTKLPEDFEFVPPKSAEIIEFTMEPQQIIEGAGEWVWVSDLTNVWRDEATAYFYGRIEYLDLFDPDSLRETTFCYRLRIFSDPAIPAPKERMQFLLMGTPYFNKAT